MATNSKIQWTEATWNPVTGCTRVSSGCDHCYAVRQTYRMERMGQTDKYAGLTVLNGKGERHFNGVVRCHEDALAIPLKRKKPTTYFVNSMSDLFHKDVPFDFIDRVFEVMALCPQHTFQILTKRPERMAEYFANDPQMRLTRLIGNMICEAYKRKFGQPMAMAAERGAIVNQWPLPNVWLGTSCENQETANERIPHLLKVPAAVRFLSLEPLLGPIDLTLDGLVCKPCSHCEFMPIDPETNEVLCRKCDGTGIGTEWAIDWIIAGGESGPHARPCSVAWLRSLRDQCKAAGVPLFVKQLGADPQDSSGGALARQATINDPKGGDMAEWPEDLRVREFPMEIEQ